MLESTNPAFLQQTAFILCLPTQEILAWEEHAQFEQLLHTPRERDLERVGRVKSRIRFAISIGWYLSLLFLLHIVPICPSASAPLRPERACRLFARQQSTNQYTEHLGHESSTYISSGLRVYQFNLPVFN
jgi:hypothetical protein